MLVVVGHVPFLLGEIFWKVQNCLTNLGKTHEESEYGNYMAR